jgi:hypothetical protein
MASHLEAPEMTAILLPLVARERSLVSQLEEAAGNDTRKTAGSTCDWSKGGMKSTMLIFFLFFLLAFHFARPDISSLW